MLLELVDFIGSFDGFFEKFEVHAAVNLASTFFWDRYCSWYLEVSKERLHANDRTVLAIHDIVIRQLLLALNPLVPFVTEELWNAGGGEDESCSMGTVRCETADDLRMAFANLPLDAGARETVRDFRDAINAVRRLLAQSGGTKEAATLCLLPKDAGAGERLKQYLPKMGRLLAVGEIAFVGDVLPLPSVQTPFGTVFLRAEGGGATNNRASIDAEIARIDALVKLNEAKLANEEFLRHAPASIVDGARKLLADNLAKRTELEKLLAAT
jgi:valyl-tRNA synthetase